jgi:DNA-binding CsgD family transcriptional regulator
MTASNQEKAFERARNRAFLNYIAFLKRRGHDEKEIALDLAISVPQLRTFKSLVTNQQRAEKVDIARRLRKEGNSFIAIARRMGISESSVRAYLKPGKRIKDSY